MPRKARKTAKRAPALNTRRDDRLTTAPNGVAVRQQKAVARVAVQLAREDAGQYMTVHEISALAAELVWAAYRARDALARGLSPRAHYRDARRVVERFGAQLVERGDSVGMVVGVVFQSGRFTSGASNIFYVA